MAQGDSVPSSSRQLITGESANQSTKLPAVGVKLSDRGYFIADLGARSITGADKAGARTSRHSPMCAGCSGTFFSSCSGF
jgi:hypothetical protein